MHIRAIVCRKTGKFGETKIRFFENNTGERGLRTESLFNSSSFLALYQPFKILPEISFAFSQSVFLGKVISCRAKTFFPNIYMYGVICSNYLV